MHGPLAFHPELRPIAIDVLREAVERDQRFAAPLHTLTNCLYTLYEETGKEELLIEIESWLRLSLDQHETVIHQRGGGEEESNGTSRHIYSDDDDDGYDMSSCPDVEDVNVHWVTVASSERPQLQALRDAIHAIGGGGGGGNLTILGAGEAWRGLGSKVTYMNQLLSSPWAQHHHCDLIAFVDAYDVMVLPMARDLPKRFKALEHQHQQKQQQRQSSGKGRRRRKRGAIVFSTETACSPDKGMKVMYEKMKINNGSGPLLYLNSGTYVGRIGDVHHMIKHVMYDIADHHGYNGIDIYHLDDQRWFTRHLFRYPHDIILDEKAEIFHTLFQLDPTDFVVKGDQIGGLCSKITQSEPCVLHGNGGAYHEVFEALSQGGWPPPFVGKEL